MSDIADIANDAAEQALASHLANARGATSALPYTGNCHYCGDITGGGARFCDADCRDDYQRERAQLKRLGRA